MKVRAQPASLVALPPPEEERRGKGRSESGSPAHTRSLLVGRGGAEKRGRFATSALAGEGRSQGSNPPPQTQKRFPRPHLPGNSPLPS